MKEPLKANNQQIETLKKNVLDAMTAMGYPVGKIVIAFNSFTGSCKIEVEKNHKLESGEKVTISKTITT